MFTYHIFIHSSVSDQHCCEHRGAGIFLNKHLWILAQERNCWVTRHSIFSILQWLHQLTLPPTVEEASLFSTLSPGFIVHRFFLMVASLTNMR